jgi:hypothetical protein
MNSISALALLPLRSCPHSISKKCCLAQLRVFRQTIRVERELTVSQYVGILGSACGIVSLR